MDKISKKNLPFPAPVTFTLAVFGCLKAFDAADIVWGVVYCLVALMWLSFFVSLANDDEYDIFGQNGNMKEKAKTVRQRIEDAMQKQKEEN